MPKKVIPHNHTEEDSIEGFMWDGFRLTEFARWFTGNFCYHNESDTLVIDSTKVNIGDWVIREDDHYLIMDKEEFESEFDLAEG